MCWRRVASNPLRATFGSPECGPAPVVSMPNTSVTNSTQLARWVRRANHGGTASVRGPRIEEIEPGKRLPPTEEGPPRNPPEQGGWEGEEIAASAVAHPDENDD